MPTLLRDKQKVRIVDEFELYGFTLGEICEANTNPADRKEMIIRSETNKLFYVDLYGYGIISARLRCVPIDPNTKAVKWSLK